MRYLFVAALSFLLLGCTEVVDTTYYVEMERPRNQNEKWWWVVEQIKPETKIRIFKIETYKDGTELRQDVLNLNVPATRPSR